MPSNKEIIRSGYEAFGRQDIPAVLSLFHPDITWTIPQGFPYGGPTYHGHEGAIQFFTTLPTVYDEIVVAPDDYVEAGDLVIARGNHRGQIGGKKFDIPFAHFWTLRDGKAVSFFEYTDTGVIIDELRAKAPAKV